ncbi:hypothetical protein [Haloplasma contractile]|nr:hypothetical protein [Haloplasma contractile]
MKKENEANSMDFSVRKFHRTWYGTIELEFISVYLHTGYDT